MAPAVILGFRAREIAIAVDGIERGTRPLFTAMIANTENGGGGLRIAPGTRLDDGILDLVEVGNASRLEVLLGVLPKLHGGSHVHHPMVRLSRGTSFRFITGTETLVDLDGETIGRLPLEGSVLPRGFFVGAVDGTD